MSKISSMLDIGKQSLMNNQTALQTISHNIANKSTEGYSRQRVEIQANMPVGAGQLRIGMGARPALVNRINNPYIEKQLEKEQSALGYAENKASAMSRVEQIFNEQQNQGLNKFLADFFNAFRELGNNPESLATRTHVRETANFLAQAFNHLHGQLRDVQSYVDDQVSATIHEINQTADEIAKLNELIQRVEVAGAPANDERDQRDLLVKKMGEKIDISYAEGQDGKITVSAAGVVLVSGFTACHLEAHRMSEANGKVHIFYKTSETATPFDIMKQIKGGALAGLFEVRDNVVDDVLERIDHLAFTVGQEVNKAHLLGFDRYSKQGQQFFNVLSQPQNAAEYIKVSSNVLNDVGKIAAARIPNAPADNTVARAIANIQYQTVMSGGRATIDDFYNGVVGDVGIFAQKALRMHETQENIVHQLANLRESVSGVSLDEEMTKMIEFQKNFDASARLVRTADEMLDTVLTLKR